MAIIKKYVFESAKWYLIFCVLCGLWAQYAFIRVNYYGIDVVLETANDPVVKNFITPSSKNKKS